jgi:carbamoyltransferase
MFILGVQIGCVLETEIYRDIQNASDHDSSAVLLKDGEIVAAMEEERLSRVKHCNFFPWRSILFCLNHVGISMADIDYVAVNFSEGDAARAAANLVYNSSKQAFLSARKFVSKNFELYYGTDISEKLIFCPHHEAHAWSTFPVSGFDKSLVVVLDGAGPSGDGRAISGIIGVSEGNQFTKLREIDLESSLGLFYCRVIRLIGYTLFDEYKVMGLAPYGSSDRFRDIFSQLYTLEEGGHYRIVPNVVLELWNRVNGIQGFTHLRRKDEAFEQVHMDFAATLQETLEKIALHVIDAAQQETNLNKLCFSGGVAHNCVLNRKVQLGKRFNDVFVQPSAHDAGGALGAAIYAQSLKAEFDRIKLKHVFLGSDINSGEGVQKTLSSWRPLIQYRKQDNVCSQVAELLVNGAVVGWVQGRSEFGPRALGNRSILADPRPPENKQRINNMIKKRESYRPFAPSVLIERATDYFDIDSCAERYPFMNFATCVREHKKKLLGAVTHIDGTARIQVVEKDSNRRYWELIHEFYKLTDVPVLLNTSFNNDVEPIVDSVNDAVTCFLTTDLTHLVVDDYIVTKDGLLDRYLGYFGIRIKDSCKLSLGSKSRLGGVSTVCTIESNTTNLYHASNVEISEELFRILSQESSGSLSSAFESLQIEPVRPVMNEIIALWDRRFVQIFPVD